MVIGHHRIRWKRSALGETGLGWLAQGRIGWKWDMTGWERIKQCFDGKIGQVVGWILRDRAGLDGTGLDWMGQDRNG